MQFAKYHGVGNDYLVLASGEPLSPIMVRALCHRHTGIGADGILEPIQGTTQDYGVRIWNPDGTAAEKSGNGLRIFARWMVDHRGAPPIFSVWTGFCKVICRVSDSSIQVDMGRGRSYPPGSAPDDSDPRWIALTRAAQQMIGVDVGNPHWVCFFDQSLEQLPWRVWGAYVETHPWFVHRTNVQFVRIDEGQIAEIRVWERGAGETLASGSSACAAVWAAVGSGRLAPSRVEVPMPGGTLWVTADARGNLLLEGPVTHIATIEVAEGWWDTLRATHRSR